jgi:hypothetical protein
VPPSPSPEHHHCCHRNPAHPRSKLNVVPDTSPRATLPSPSPRRPTSARRPTSVCRPTPPPSSPQAAAAHHPPVWPTCPRCASTRCLQTMPGAAPGTTAVTDSASRCPSLPSLSTLCQPRCLQSTVSFLVSCYVTVSIFDFVNCGEKSACLPIYSVRNLNFWN